MKVIQVPFCFYPDPVGGTEVYVESLSKHLKRRGMQVLIAAPGESGTRYTHEGLPVRRFAVSSALDLTDLYGQGDRKAAEGFSRILDEECPDAVHLHAFTAGVSLRLVREVKQRGIPVVFTYHTPTVSCQRGTLMRWGNEVCDGRLILDLCARCTLHGLGLPRVFSDVIGRVPVAAGKVLGWTRLSGGGWTALRMRELVFLKHLAVRGFFQEVDRIVAVCQWVQDLLVLNGVPSSKVILCRQGLAQEGVARPSTSNPPLETASKPQQPSLRVAFLGRLESVKGAHILIQAIRGDRDLPATLDLYGIPSGTNPEKYVEFLHRLTDGDRRIHFYPPIPGGQVIERLQGYDLLAVPSQWLETGPLVVLEAFAAGIPVLGSRLGGIEELVKHEVNGLVVEPGSIRAFTDALRRICQDKELLIRLRVGVSTPRTMATVAEEMEPIYRKLLSSSHASI